MSVRNTSSPARPRAVPASSSPPHHSRALSPPADSTSRATSIARLTSSPAAPSISTPASNKAETEKNAPLAGAGGQLSGSGPGQSSLAAALQAFGRSPPRFGTPSRNDTPPPRPISPVAPGITSHGSEQPSLYGSFDTRSMQGARGRSSPVPNENPDIVKRHLVQSSDLDGSDEGVQSNGTSHKPSSSNLRHGKQSNINAGLDADEFSSLRLQGGDMTREVYRWAEDAEAQSQSGGLGKRSKSFHLSRPRPESGVPDISSIKVPGGFRRNYLQSHGPSPPHEGRGQSGGLGHIPQERSPPRMFTHSFIEFLTLYGHFAGEELEEDDEELEPGEYISYDDEDSDEGEEEDGNLDESRALLPSGVPKRRKRRRRERGPPGTSSPAKAILLLIKAFVGTGVLFLPKAYKNGGMAFSNAVLAGVALLNYYCFLLLVAVHEKIGGSFGDMGGILYGKYMRVLILASIALSQVGFVAAYIVFTAENLQAFIVAISNCRTWIDIKFIVLMQLVIFLPFSLIRDISKLGFTALVADAFILLGLLYLTYYDIYTLAANHGISDIVNFNPRDWNLFIGTAVFTFEGIGLIIPIKEAMKQPAKFPTVLAVVMVIITVIFVGMGALSYAAFGSSTRTVILLNLPQDNRFVNVIQLLYSLAILLSTPLQLFPAIRILENGIFTRSGKHHPYIKWKKNVFRFFLVIVCALIAWGGAGDLDKFVALIGNFACLPLVFIYPVSHHALLDLFHD